MNVLDCLSYRGMMVSLDREIFRVCSTIIQRAEQFKLVVVQLRLLILLLNSEQWRYFPLSVQFLSSEYAPLLCGLPPLPHHVPVTFAPPEVCGILQPPAPCSPNTA